MLAALLTTAAQAQQVDCNAPANPSHVAICSDTPAPSFSLRQKDEQVGALFAQAGGWSGPNAASQYAFNVLRDAVVDKELLHILYDHRIAKLKTLAVTAVAPQLGTCALSGVTGTTLRVVYDLNDNPNGIVVIRRTPGSTAPALVHVINGADVNVVNGVANQAADGQMWSRLSCNGEIGWVDIRHFGQ